MFRAVSDSQNHIGKQQTRAAAQCVQSATAEPLVRSRLDLAGVHVHLLLAVAAAHGAAPVELALALGGLAVARRVVAPTAAHHLAAVHAAGRPVTHPPPGPQRACRGRRSDQCKV